MTQAEIIALIRQKAFNYAVSRNAPDQAESFFRAIVAIAYGESGLNPNAIRDTTSGHDLLVASGQAQRELSVGLFQNNIRGGRGTGYSAEQLKDPNLNIDISLDSLWSAFQRAGGAKGFAANPEAVTAYTYEKGQGSVPPNMTTQVLPGLALTSGNVVAATAGNVVGQTSWLLGPDGAQKAAQPATATGGAPTTFVPATAATAPGPGWWDAQIASLQDQISRDEARLAQIVAKPESSRTEQDSADLARIQGDEVMGVVGSLASAYDKLAALQKIKPEDAATTAEFPANEANFAAGIAGATTGAAADAAKNWGTAYGNVAGIANTSANLATTAAQLESSYWDGVQQALTDIFGAEDRRAALIYNILDGNRKDTQEVVASAMQKGQLDQQAAENVLAAVAARQAAHLGYAAKVLEQAQWIDSVRFRNAMRRLPPGTMYQPGFEPDSTINSSLRALGLNPTVIHAQVVADSEIDPLTALRDSDAAMPAGARPGADMDEAVAGVQAAAARTQALQSYQGQQINPDDLGLSNIPAYAQAVMGAAQQRPRPDFAAQQGMLGAAAQGTLDAAGRYDTANQQSAAAAAAVGEQYLGSNAAWRQPRVVQNPNTTAQGTTVQSSPPAPSGIVPSNDTPATSLDSPLTPGGHWEGDDFVLPDGTRIKNARSNPRQYGLAA